MSENAQHQEMSFLIYGAGALGQAIGCMLAKSGHTVDMLLRPRFIEQIRANGLQVDGVLGQFQAPPENIGLIDILAKAQGEYDYILITTKSYDTRAATQDIKNNSIKAGAVVSLQNGCGNLEELVAAFGAECSLGGRVITGFEINGPGRINISVTADAIHVGGSVAGSIPQTATNLAAAITMAGHACLAVTDIHASLYAKLLYNCALNPLGAILGVHYGALADSSETRSIIDGIIDETFNVIMALGGSTPWKNADEYRSVFYDQLIPATYSHRASMLQDLESGKPTEVEALVGYVSEKGREKNLDTPVCDLVAAMVRFKERFNRANGQ